ncbi:MAG: rod shape-determining protein MreC [Candidatus Binataceae bacterium]
MRGSFLWRNRVLLASGALLLLSLHLLSTGVSPGARVAKPSLFLMEVLRPVQIFESALVNDSTSFVHDYFDLVNVRQQDLVLKQRLAELESQTTKLKELEVENHHLSDLLELRDALTTKAVAASVIGADAGGLARTLVLSEGGHNGLRRDMAVVSTDGVVGKLIAVSPDSSRVLLISDHNSAVDTFDQRSRARGIVAGVVDDGLTMKYVDRSEDIKAGDQVVTSGMDGIFPRGLLIGTVASVSREGPGLFLKVDVEPAADFTRIEQVLVLTQKPSQLPPPPGNGAN